MSNWRVKNADPLVCSKVGAKLLHAIVSSVMMRRTLMWALAVILAQPLRAQVVPVPQTPEARRALLLDPAKPFWKTHAPDTVTADVETSRGLITLQLIRAWAPNGVDRFYNLARAGYYDDSRFYRVLFNFVAQFGLAGNPAITQAWARRDVPADPPREKNVRGTLSFAQNKSTDRTTNVFINLSDHPALDTLKFVPIGRVTEGMSVADSLFAVYGEGPSNAAFGGDVKRLFNEGNKYLDEKYPLLDHILRITVRAAVP
jgi:peptidyl-prolyl cis-trans isomerase A (cyclophilin A)